MKRGNKLLSLIIVIAMCISFCPGAALADEKSPADDTGFTEEVVQESGSTNAAEDSEEADEAEPVAKEAFADDSETVSETEPVSENSVDEGIVSTAQSDASVLSLDAIETEASGSDAEKESLADDVSALDSSVLEDPQTEYISDTWVNPIYQDIYDAGLLILNTAPKGKLSLGMSTSSVISDSGNVFEDVENAAAYIREQMKARNESIVFTYTFSDGYDASVVSEIWSKALAHTGEPDEGDYIRYQYGGYNMSGSGSGNSWTLTFTVTYYTTYDQEIAMDSAVENAVNALSLDEKTEYEKVEAIHDYILENVTYDNDHLGEDYNLQYTGYAALVNGTSVCQGYAVLTYRLMLEAGIDCRIISGTANNGSSTEDHAWNIVKLGDYYYYLDTTWDDGTSSLDYFLKCGFSDHSVDTDEFPESFFETYTIASSDYSPEESGTEQTIVATGTCGEALTWMLTDDGVLTISGTGAMEDYRSSIGMPWYQYRKSLTSVTIEEGVSTIGDWAFFDFSGLESVSIPSSVTNIGQRAFSGCSSIVNIDIPNGVESIEVFAFEDCVGLTEITLPASVTTFESRVFDGCSALQAIYVNEDNTVYSSIDGVIYSEDGKTLICFPAGYPETVFSIPETVETVGAFAFYDCTKLTSVTIPESVTVINHNAFRNCSGLTGITFPNSLRILAGYAFSGCAGIAEVTIPAGVNGVSNCAFSECSSLTGITVETDNQYYMDEDGVLFNISGSEILCYPAGRPGENYEIPNDVTSIMSGAFQGCVNLKAVTIPSGVTTIDSWTFSGCGSLESVTIPESVTSIGGRAFNACTSLASVTIPESVTSIGVYAFNGCTGLTAITFEGDAPTFGTNAFYDVTATAYYPAANTSWTEDVMQDYGGSITWETVATEAFSGTCGDDLTWELTDDGLLTISGTGTMTDYESCKSPWYGRADIVSVVLEDSVTSIGSYAFSQCTGLTSITIPASATSIGDSAFMGCTGLTEITFEGDAPTIGTNVFYDVTATAYYPAANTSWTEDVMQDYGGSITWKAVASGTCGDDLTWELTDDGVLTISGTGAMERYRGSGSPWYDCREDIVSVVLTDGVTSIGSYAFYKCTGLMSVTIPESVTSIGGNAFYGCTGLTSVTIPAGVNSIGVSPFCACPDLEITVDADNPVYHIAGNCLIETEAGTLIQGFNGSVIPSDGSVTSIGDYAFYKCTDLTSVTIPESVTSIGGDAFYGCTGLTSVTIPAGVNSIGVSPFRACPDLEITMDEDNPVYHIAGNCLIETEAGTLIQGFNGSVIPSDGSVTSIGDYAFYNCTGLMSVTIPESVTSIGSYAFYKCTGLTSVTIPESASMIGIRAFQRCTGLTSVTILNDVTHIRKYAFYECSGLTDVYYAGSEEDWAAIAIESNNDCLTNATIHYIYRITIDAENCVVTVLTDYDELSESGITVNDGDYVEYGKELVVTAQPKAGCEMTVTPEATYTVTGDLTISAKAAYKSYALTLTHENGAAPTANVDALDAILYGTAVTLTAGAANEGYEFIGWYQTNGKQLTEDESYTFTMFGDTTCEARYQLSSGVVTFMANDQVQKTILTTSISESDFPAAPAAPYGYTFSGWDKTVDKINAALSSGGNVTVTAQFTAIQQNMTLTIYNGESETPTTQHYTSSQWVSVTANTVSGKSFAYWTMDGEIFSYNAKATFRIASSCTIIAVYSTDAVEAVGTATIKTVTYNAETNKLATVSYLTVPDGAEIVQAGLFATSPSLEDVSFDPTSQELNEETAKYVKCLSKAVGTGGPVTYMWTKTSVSIGDVWYLRPYVSYTYNGNTETVYGSIVTVSAGYDYDGTEKGTAAITSTSYNSSTEKASFVAFLTIPNGGSIVKAGLVASPSASFDPTTSVLTWDNAVYKKAYAKAVGTAGPVIYTWTKTRVASGDTWYVRPYVIYTDANGSEHTVYGALVSYTAGS